MNNRFLRVVASTAFLCILFIQPILAVNGVSPQKGETPVNKLWSLQMLNTIKLKAKEGAVVKVAVVDDAFRLSHLSLKKFFYSNNNEIPDNFQDDDLNGYIDDVLGYDVSDGDNDVSIPKGKEQNYFHGTYIAGIITSLFQQCYGEDADRHLKIIPVKVLANNAKNTYLADGYKGIRYACDMGADIICCAWSGGAISDDDKAVISKAIANGTIIIGAAGNFFSEKNETPSSLPGVISVAAIDSSFKKSPQSNFGMRVDLAAPGVNVYGPFSDADNAFIFENGTSPATALITGCFAILKAFNPDASSAQLIDALKFTSLNIDKYNLSYCGKLGTGVPDIAKAIEFISNPHYKYANFNPSQPEGRFFYKKKWSKNTWDITPDGAYKGLHLYSASDQYKGELSIYSNDSLYFSGSISSIARGTFIPGSKFKVVLKNKPKASSLMAFNYHMQTIDSTTLYCNDLIDITDTSGTITDNSGSNNYANNCSCKWQLTAPPGKRIRIIVDQMDTQPNIDFIWIFDGDATLQENLIAKFSGNNTPPIITSFSNKALIWFLTDSDITAQGWHLIYEAIEE